MIAQEKAWIEVREEFDQLLKYAQRAAQRGRPMHETEEKLWEGMLKTGLAMLKGFVAAQGTGDVGECVVVEGRRLARLAEAQPRRYVSVFGELEICRAVYGKRRKQKFVVPLDARLQLPEGEFSYLLQDWTQGHCVEQAFDKAGESLAKILKLKQAVRSMEHMNREMAEEVAEYRDCQGPPPRAEEAELLVAMADCKGIPMRRGTDDARPQNPQHLSKGEKKNKKQMACVGCVYTVERHSRIPEQVLNEVLRKETEARRPKPQHKRLRAELSREVNGQAIDGKDTVFSWLKQELEARDPRGRKTAVFLSDGEHSLQEKAESELGARKLVHILDLMHVTPRLWAAAHCFWPEGSEAAQSFFNLRLDRILHGEVDGVVRGLRQMATKQKLRGNKAKTITQVTQYYENNRERMEYDRYLALGYPIGTGPVEGACRNLIRDRMERTGMRWSVPGAQAMLDLRAVYLNGDWDDYCSHRIQDKTERLYPYRALFSPTQWQAVQANQGFYSSPAASVAAMPTTTSY